MKTSMCGIHQSDMFASYQSRDVILPLMNLCIRQQLGCAFHVEQKE